MTSDSNPGELPTAVKQLVSERLFPKETVDKLPLRSEAVKLQELWEHHYPHNEDIPTSLLEGGEGHRQPKDMLGIYSFLIFI